MNVTHGVCQKIANEETFDGHPVLQVLEIKPIGHSPNLRYRMTVTDGITTLSAMLATQMHHWFQEDKLRPNCIIELVNHVYQKMPSSTNKLLVCIEIKVVGQLDTPLIEVGGVSSAGASVTSVKTVPFAPSVPETSSTVFGQSTAYGQAPSYGQAPTYGQAATASLPSYGYPGAQPQTHSSSVPAYGHGSQQLNGQLPGNRGPIIKDESSGGYTPISAITPYSNKWTIKARVTRKTDVKRWSNAKGEGTLFSVDLTDASSAIRATFFKDACEKFFPILHEGNVYSFSLGRVKLVQNKQFSTLNNPYELQFEASSDIRPCEDDHSIGQMRFNFVKIRDIQDLEVQTEIDVLGIVKSVGEVQEINSAKLQKMLHKRDLVIFDDSLAEVRLTLWGDRATDVACNSYTSQVIAFKGVRVGDFGGKNLGSTSSTAVTMNPRIPEAERLYHWCVNSPDVASHLSSLSVGTGGSLTGPRATEPLEKRRTVAAVKDDNLGMSEKGDYISFRATVKFIKHEQDPYYTACPNDSCNKKVTELGNNMWRCEKCNKEFDTCKRRYILNITVTDHTAEQWVSLFNDDAERLLGISADELHRYKEIGDEAKILEVYQNALFKTFVFSARVKMESVNDELRLKCTVTRADQIDFESESKQMIDAISKYN